MSSFTTLLGSSRVRRTKFCGGGAGATSGVGARVGRFAVVVDDVETVRTCAKGRTAAAVVAVVGLDG